MIAAPRRLLATAAVATGLLALPAGAHAQAPVLGDYVCTSYGGGVSQAAGVLNVTGSGSYTVNSGEVKGSFTHDPATRVVTFSSGVYDSFYGMYDPDEKGIDIHDKADGLFLWGCNWDASTASRYGTGGGAGGGATATQPPATAAPAPAAGGPGLASGPAAGLGVRFPRGVKLLPSLSNGFVVGVDVAQAGTLTGVVRLSARDARRYGLGRRSVVVGRDSARVAAGRRSLEFKPSRKVARRLRRARRLRLTLDLSARWTDGRTSRTRSTLTLSR